MPKALYIGVPYEMFWKMNPAKLKPYERAYEMRIKDEDERDFRHGQYMMAALATVNGGKNVYPDKPMLSDFEMFPEEHDYSVDAEKFWAYAIQYNAERRERSQ